jgi:hypothetical protein
MKDTFWFSLNSESSMKRGFMRLGIIIAIAMLTFASCGNEPPDQTPPDNVFISRMILHDGKVYAAGGVTKYDTDYNVIDLKLFYMIDGKRTYITVPEGAKEFSITGMAVEGGNVYLSGTGSIGEYPSRTYLARYWKNSEICGLEIPDGARQHGARGIAVYDGKVYVSGYYYIDDNADYKAVPCYWIDGEKTELLSNGKKSTIPSGIAVHNGTVYVYGTYTGSSGTTACFWVNDEIIFLETSTYSETTGIFIQNDTVYISGIYDFSNNKGCYWTAKKNQNKWDIKRFYLPRLSGSYNENNTRGIISLNGDVYIAGSCWKNGQDPATCFWKHDGSNANAIVTKLLSMPDYYSYVSGISTQDDKIYVYGSYSGGNSTSYCYWLLEESGVTKVDIEF